MAPLFRAFKPFTGPMVWYFKDPDTGQEFDALNKAALMKLVIDYRRQNDLAEIEMLAAVVENYTCLRRENKYKCCENKKLHRKFFAYLQGGVGLLKYYFLDKQVSDEVAEERAAQCLNCPFNTFPDKKGFLAWSDSVAEASTGGRRVSCHKQLGNCSVCTCVLKMKVFAEGPFSILPDQEVLMKGVNCWQLKG